MMESTASTSRFEYEEKERGIHHGPERLLQTKAGDMPATWTCFSILSLFPLTNGLGSSMLS
jgi:hypothetical protein